MLLNHHKDWHTFHVLTFLSLSRHKRNESDSSKRHAGGVCEGGGGNSRGNLQCDRMAFIVFIICPFYYHEKLPNCVQNLTKVVTLFARYYINLHEIAKDILFYAKVAKFNEIWSHWGKIV